MKTLIHVGEWDLTYGPNGVKSWLSHSRYLGNDIWEQPRRVFILNSTDSEVVGGYWRSDSKNLITVLTLAKSGHSALRSSLPTLKQAVSDMLSSDGKLLCHSNDLTNCDTSKAMCIAVNACGVYGICGYDGQCVCNAGWSGADCSQKAQLLTAFFSKQYNINGT